MSEQEKNNAIPAEGAITEVPDERSWLKKFTDKHPKVWKWTKRIAAGIGVGAGMFAMYKVGRASKGEKSGEATLNITEAEPPEEIEEGSIEISEF